MENLGKPNLPLNILPIRSAPTLYQVNGIGSALLGETRVNLPKELQVKQRFLALLWIPLIPLGIYVVKEKQGGVFDFYGRLRFADFARNLKARGLMKYYLGVATESALIFFLIIALFWCLDSLLGLFGYRILK